MPGEGQALSEGKGLYSGLGPGDSACTYVWAVAPCICKVQDLYNTSNDPLSCSEHLSGFPEQGKPVGWPHQVCQFDAAQTVPRVVGKRHPRQAVH